MLTNHKKWLIHFKDHNWYELTIINKLLCKSMIIKKSFERWFNGFWECPFTDVEIHISETLATNKSIRCPEFRGGQFLEVAYVL